MDLESNLSNGQWRTIEEHERLQQEGTVASTANGNPDYEDYYGQREQVNQSRKKLAWIAGGEQQQLGC